MQQKKISSRIYSLAKSALAAAVLPIFLIYIMIDKPDYKVMNAAAHVILPAAHWTGGVLSWPLRALGDAAENIRKLSAIRSENEELRAKLDEALRSKNECDVVISDNQLLRQEMDIIKEMPQKAIVAGITQDNKAFHHNTFFISKGISDGVEVGMAVVSFEGTLVGIVSDCGVGYAKVRALTDSKSNIPVRIAGSEVYGFLQGNGSGKPSIGFFSDPEFQAIEGLRLVTSSIRGVLPDGIAVGETTSETDTDVTPAHKGSNVMVLKFDGKDKYK